MKPDLFKEIHQYGHDDDRRYQLLMRRLRIIHSEKTQYTPIQRLKKRMEQLKKTTKSKRMGRHSSPGL